MCRPHVVVPVVAVGSAVPPACVNLWSLYCIYDSAWASDHYALVYSVGRFTITKYGKRVHCAFIEQSFFSSQSFNQIPSNPACWPSKARLGDPRIKRISFPSKRGTSQPDLPDAHHRVQSSEVFSKDLHRGISPRYHLLLFVTNWPAIGRLDNWLDLFSWVNPSFSSVKEYLYYTYLSLLEWPLLKEWRRWTKEK